MQGIATIVEFQLSDSLSPWERARERVKPFWNAVIPIFKKPPFKTDTDKRDGRTWILDLVP